MTTIAVIQARAGSSRLPQKVLADVGGRSMLAKVVARAQRARLVDEVVVATTEAPADDLVAQIAEQSGARVHRGPVLDVLERYLGALTHYQDTDVVVRITADCPFVDPDLIDLCVARLVEHGSDFVANRLPPPHARTYPVGLDVEVARLSALRSAGREAVETYEREHVMPYLYHHPNLFEIEVLDLDTDLSAQRWTVDTADDLAAARAIDALAGPEPYGWLDVLRVVREHPEIGDINRAHTQRMVDEVDRRWDAVPPTDR